MLSVSECPVGGSSSLCRQSNIGEAKVLHYIPGLGPTNFAVERVQVREPNADDSVNLSHNPL